MNGYSNGNGTTASASSNLNGSSASHNGSSPSSSNTQRSLLIIHKPSNTRLSIDGVPETLLGYALDLRDEFLEHLNESGKGEKLVLEAAPKASSDEDNEQQQDEASSSSTSSNNAHLFLASYWLEFLSSPSKHEISLPILSSSRDYFLSHFMQQSTLDIHSIAGKLNDVDEKKLVLRSWFETCSKIGDGYYGPTGKIWDGKNNTNIYAVFGGQVSCSSSLFPLLRLSSSPAVSLAFLTDIAFSFSLSSYSPHATVALQGSNEYYFDEFEVSIST